MKWRAEGDEWPPHLATFDPSDWPPEPGDPPWAAGHSVLAAHHRWCKARLARLVEGTPEYGAEQLRGMRENVALIRGNPPKRGER